MSSFTFADHKLGGRLTACCEAIGAGHLRRAAGIFNELADDLNSEAEAATGLLSEEPEAEVGTASIAELPAPALAVKGAPADLESCARGAHRYGEPAPITGWRTCASCQMVNVSPPDNNGPIDMSIRQ